MNNYRKGLNFILNNSKVKEIEIEVLLTRFPELKKEVEIFGEYSKQLEKELKYLDTRSYELGINKLYWYINDIIFYGISFLGKDKNELEESLFLRRPIKNINEFLIENPDIVKIKKGYYRIDFTF